jgi:hypothetical protein
VHVGPKQLTELVDKTDSNVVGLIWPPVVPAGPVVDVAFGAGNGAVPVSPLDVKVVSETDMASVTDGLEVLSR